MNAILISRTDSSMTLQVEIPFGRSMLQAEELIQKGVNEIGMLATGEALMEYDTDGSAIIVGDVKYTSKGQTEKEYETPYGKVGVERHVYQTMQGGKTYCPLDVNARIVVSSTPRFAKMISYKYTEGGSARVAMDLQENNGRVVARSFIQNVADAVGSIALAKEESWHYNTPKLEERVETISIGLDGTCMYMSHDGFRLAMVGTIALYNVAGERLHTTYVAATPEYGKETFIQRLEKEIEHVKGLYPEAKYIGLADGASDNWIFLEKHTSIQTLDFYHAADYLSDAADAMFGSKKNKEKTLWLETSCHNLKHKHGAATRLLGEMEGFAPRIRSPDDSEKLQAAITYFGNQKHRMKYAQSLKLNLPIGSGVTEAACKVIVKQRMCCSGMKWKDRGAKVVLSLRCLNYSRGRWNQFWSKIDKYGVPVSR